MKKPAAGARSAKHKAKGKPAKKAAARPAAAGSKRPAAATARPAPAASRGAQGGASMANVRPLRDRVLVRRVEEQEQKVGGIIVPDTAKEKPQQAEVVAVGPGRVTDDGKRVALEVKTGDKILMGKYSGTEVKIDGNEYLIMREEDVLAIVG